MRGIENTPLPPTKYPTSCANRLSFLLLTTRHNVFLINSIDFYYPLSFPCIFDRYGFIQVESIIPFAVLGFYSNNFYQRWLSLLKSNISNQLYLKQESGQMLTARAQLRSL
jgi:hypothetical protein